MPRSHHILGLATRNFIDVGAEVVDLDYWGEMKVVLYNHVAKDFMIHASDWIAQLILEKIQTPQVKKVVTLDDTNRGVGGFENTKPK